ncbi:MAG: GspH/FimT family pseudopilin [Gallionella sp.]|nr:GspH/FimT family pseudopilin [Gallionella sp.]
MGNKHTQAGFTLMELMVVVAIAAILATIAAPSFNSLINDTKQSSLSSQLVSDLHRARSEAIKRNTRVVLCVRNSAGTDCGTGTNWQNGWLICYGNTACDATLPTDGSAANPISTHPPLDSKLTLTGSGNLIRFNPNGTQGSAGNASLTLNRTWSAATAKPITVAATGYISKY